MLVVVPMKIMESPIAVFMDVLFWRFLIIFVIYKWLTAVKNLWEGW